MDFNQPMQLMWSLLAVKSTAVLVFYPCLFLLMVLFLHKIFRFMTKSINPFILGLDFFIANDALLGIAQNTLFLKDPISNHVLAIHVRLSLSNSHCQSWVCHDN